MGSIGTRGRYLAIADELGAAIRAGKYRLAHSFPSLTQIVKRFKVSRPTAMRAVSELKRMGLLGASPRSSTFVTGRGGSRRIGLIVPGVAVTDFFKKVSMGDCRTWLQAFLVRWEKMLKTSGK